MTEQNLFKTPPEKKSKEKKTTFYNKFDLISYFIKNLRIGNKDKAIALLHIMLNEGLTEKYIAKKLVHCSSEDIVGMEYFNYAKNVYDFIKEEGTEINSLSRLIIDLCDAPKFREVEKESYRESRRIRIREHIKQLYRKKKKPLELPEFVFDIYTAKGKASKKRGESIDERYSGVLLGGLYMRAEYLKYGKLEPSKTEKGFLKNIHLQKCLKEHYTIDEYLSQNKDVNIDDFFTSSQID